MRPEPIILAFDTSAAHCAAALLMGGRIVTHVDEMSKGQAEHLMPMLSQLLSDNGITWSDLTAIGVGIGPGNFTGIRIAVSAARGLALALNIPSVGVDGFEVLAYNSPRPVTVRIAAPRGQAYVRTLTETGATDPFLTECDAPDPTLPGQEVARRIALITADRADSQPPRPAPLYVRAADAAPPRDPAPVILP